jgi:hypothetical protein
LDYRVTVIGSAHSALVCGTYLATSVLEGREVLGDAVNNGRVDFCGPQVSRIV